MEGLDLLIELVDSSHLNVMVVLGYSSWYFMLFHLGVGHVPLRMSLIYYLVPLSAVPIVTESLLLEKSSWVSSLGFQASAFSSIVVVWWL
jgi:hypothetical protein